VILGVVQRYLVEKYICPLNCSFSDIFGPDMMRRIVAFCMGHPGSAGPPNVNL